MIKNKSLYFVIVMTFISSISLVYFYTLQRNFTENHKEFLLSLSQLDNSQDDLKTSILINSIYTYESQDNIAKNINKLQDDFTKLSKASILNSEKYSSIKEKILESLQQKIKADLNTIEKYNMLNAAIKNSLVFLTRHVENALNFRESEQHLYIEGSKIIQRYNNTKIIQDLDYIHKDNYFLHCKTTDIEIQTFIKSFNLHSKFIFKKIPHYINVTNKILNNNINTDIDTIRNDFSQIALKDFKLLDYFALVLFSIFILSSTFVILLLIKYIKNHSNLLKTTANLEHSLNYDLLTNLRNRFAFEKDLQSLKKPHLLILNIDGFKQINDIYGNDVGNILLKQIAHYITDFVSNVKGAKVYRIGGDEFGFLFENINSNYALEFAYKLENEISQHSFNIDLLHLNISASIASNNVAPVFENADLALKEIKKDRTSRVIEYKDSLNLKQSIEDNLRTLDFIKKAILHDRIVPYFQPIVNLNTLKIEKYEALVRIIQENGQILTPNNFLEVSKKTPYYHEITKIMIEKTLHMAKEYPLYRFSINISMIDILDQDIVDILYKALDKDISISSRIDIELLESEDLQSIEQVQNFIKRLHDYGSKILIDDFGSGYSNFSYFADLDIDIVKIDGSIVREIVTNERKLHMLKSVHQFSKGMDLENVAEFVETKEIALLLKALGVTYAQGYYFGKPCARPLESNIITI